MLVSEPKKILSALALSTSLILTGCGGGSNDGSSRSGGRTASVAGTPGPLDVVQEPLSNSVFSTLIGATAGTPLAGVLECADDLIVRDFLDTIDAILVQVDADPTSLDDPTSLFATSAPDLEAAVSSLAAELPAFLASLTGAGCVDTGGGSAGDNPLTGTALAPLGDALAPVLSALPIDAGNPNISSIADAVALLAEAYASGLATVYSQDTDGTLQNTPVIPGLLDTVGDALTDLQATVEAAEAMNTDATATALMATLNHLLDNVLTNVLPIGFIEDEAGVSIISDLIGTDLDALTGLVGGDFSGLLSGDFEALLDADFTSLLTDLGVVDDVPVVGGVVDLLLETIEGALGGGFPAVTTDTGLDAVLAPLNSVGDALFATSSEPTGTPLDVILGPIYQGLLSDGSCLVGGSLDPLCDITQELLDGLTLDPDADPLALLDDAITTVLDLLSL